MFNINILKPVIFFILSALVITGIWVHGYLRGENKAEVKWATELANLKAASEQQIAELYKQSSEINETVVVEYVDRVQEVVKNKIVYRDVIKEVLVPSQCNLSNGWVEVHDAAANNKDVTISEVNNEQSNVSDTQGLTVVVDNYSICHQNTNQLIALQDWINQNYIQINGEVAQ